MSEIYVIYRDCVTVKYVKETDQENPSAETHVMQWTGVRTEAQKFYYPTFNETCPPINDVAGNEKWRTKRDATSKRQLEMLAFQRKNQLEQLPAEEEAGTQD